MITVVIVTNCFISLVCLYLTWRAQRLRKSLVQLTTLLLMLEQSTHNLLHGVPSLIKQGTEDVYWFRQQYDQLQAKVHDLQRVMMLLQMVQLVWRANSFRRIPRRKFR